MSNFDIFFSASAPEFLATWWFITIVSVFGTITVVMLIALLYKPFFKVFFDIVLSFFALVFLSPLFLLLAIIIKATSRGPVFFKQKRVGKNKKLFYIHKFRTMRIDTPKDMPTHLLANPDQYITRIGKFLRKTSLDELPQIWDIFKGKMSIIGPRPALYNQDDLVAERDKYKANSIRPGLTGLAQVSGRDELEIEVKAKVDGDYIKKHGFFIDVKIFLLTVLKVFKSDGVVEGGTGTMATMSCKIRQPIKGYCLKAPFHTLRNSRGGILSPAKKTLITGANSYVGTNIENWLKSYRHSVTTLDMLDPSWQEFDFSPYGTVLHVAGIAHDLSGDIKDDLYMQVNYQLALDVANKAKEAGVTQFIQMSSMSVYNAIKDKNITDTTPQAAKDAYGNSKLRADLALQEMHSEDFNVAILRPPMIFGKNSKGNFNRLISLSLKAPFFPKVKNKRSMLYIDNLSELVRLIIEHSNSGIFFPQNPEYFNSTNLAVAIAKTKGKRLRTTRLFNLGLKLSSPFIASIKKLFGNLTYDMALSKNENHFNGNYQVVDNDESIALSM